VSTLLFADLLTSDKGKKRHTAQAKFYLSEETYARLRKVAADRGSAVKRTVSNSERTDKDAGVARRLPAAAKANASGVTRRLS
jgi:hypothetical protein